MEIGSVLHNELRRLCVGLHEIPQEIFLSSVKSQFFLREQDSFYYVFLILSDLTGYVRISPGGLRLAKASSILPMVLILILLLLV